MRPPPLVARFLEGGGPAVDPALPDLDRLGSAELSALAPLPYASPGFGRRAVTLQLSQASDQGSRRRSLVAAQVAWLAAEVALTSVLHPLCGPGVVAAALRDAGTIEYLGVDSNLAAIERASAAGRWPDGFDFLCGDALQVPAPWGRAGNLGLGLLTYESLNAFAANDASRLLTAIGEGLGPAATLAAEVRLEQPPSPRERRSWAHWPTGSLFAAGPHLLLVERGQSEDAVVDRFLVAPTRPASRVEAFHSIVWLYPRPRLEALLADAGWRLLALLRPPPLETDNEDAANNAYALAERALTSPDR